MNAKAVELNTPENVFKTLYSFDVGPFVQNRVQGGRQIDYLEWATAWRLIKEIYPTAAYHLETAENNMPFFASDYGVLVKIVVMIGPVTQIEWYPVDADREGKISTFEITNAHQRGLVKCLGRLGLGLKLWEKTEREEMAQSSNSSRHTSTGASSIRTTTPLSLSSTQEYRINVTEKNTRTFGKTLEEAGVENVRSDWAYWSQKTDLKPGSKPFIFLQHATPWLKAKDAMRGHKDFEQPPPPTDDDYPDIPL